MINHDRRSPHLVHKTSVRRIGPGTSTPSSIPGLPLDYLRPVCAHFFGILTPPTPRRHFHGHPCNRLRGVYGRLRSGLLPRMQVLHGRHQKARPGHHDRHLRTGRACGWAHRSEACLCGCDAAPRPHPGQGDLFFVCFLKRLGTKWVSLDENDKPYAVSVVAATLRCFFFFVV